MNSAVLFIIFNRPSFAHRVFDVIRVARPSRLYIAADGPRAEKIGEREKCEGARSIVDRVDWPCELKVLFREKNLGCRNGVSSAIDWFFKNEEEGIILEDDCLPSLSFFQFCDEMLEYYRDDDRIGQISGSNFIGADAADGASYFFSNYPDIWGWATWRRSWQHYDVSMRDWESWSKKKKIIPVSNGNRIVAAYWKKNFEKTWRGKIDTWDYQWIFSCWKRSVITVLPAINQIENLGYGSDATHTTHLAPTYIQKAECLAFPLVRPLHVGASAETDREISEIRYRISFVGMVSAALRNIPIVARIIKTIKHGLS